MGGGIDFASTALRVNFNDLQSDRVFPDERFYVVSRDGRLVLLTLADGPGGAASAGSSACKQPGLVLEPILDIKPPLEKGEIVTVCGCGEVVIVCRHSGQLTILRRAPAPMCSTSIVGCLYVSEFGSQVGTDDHHTVVGSKPTSDREDGSMVSVHT